MFIVGIAVVSAVDLDDPCGLLLFPAYSCPQVFPINAKKCKIFSSIFTQIFLKCETAFFILRSSKQRLILAFFFLWRCDVWHGVMTIFFLTARKMQKATGSRYDDLFFFEITLQIAENMCFLRSAL